MKFLFSVVSRFLKSPRTMPSDIFLKNMMTVGFLGTGALLILLIAGDIILFLNTVIYQGGYEKSAGLRMRLVHAEDIEKLRNRLDERKNLFEKILGK